jgi:hypothetical protein
MKPRKGSTPVMGKEKTGEGEELKGVDIWEIIF